MKVFGVGLIIVAMVAAAIPAHAVHYTLSGEEFVRAASFADSVMHGIGYDSSSVTGSIWVTIADSVNIVHSWAAGSPFIVIVKKCDVRQLAEKVAMAWPGSTVTVEGHNATITLRPEVYPTYEVFFTHLGNAVTQYQGFVRWGKITVTVFVPDKK